ncbi:MAG: hypothetical protein QG559_1553 [Campylobacterota bacterium]|nr:hypothetical protein [Campylobacterota bacterium]
MNFHSLISQLSDSEKKELFELIQKRYAIEPLVHQSLAGLMMQQDKELKELLMTHRHEILDFIGDKNV